MNEEIKIESISIKNLKNISEFYACLGGKSAHITGQNGKGKTTALRTFTDRLRGLSPEKITKIGETEGKTEMVLTDGGRFAWRYNSEGFEKIDYFPPESTRPAPPKTFKSIVELYFPNLFDINKFLKTSEPRKRLALISSLINIDLTDVQKRYNTAFENRRDQKRILKEMQAQNIQIPKVPQSPEKDGTEQKEAIVKIKKELTELQKEIQDERNFLNSQYLRNKAENEKLISENEAAYQIELDIWEKEEAGKKSAIDKHNDTQRLNSALVGKANMAIEDLRSKIKDLSELLNTSIDVEELNNSIAIGFKSLPKIEDLKEYKQGARPVKKELKLPDPMPKPVNLNALLSEQENKESVIKLHGGALEEINANNADYNTKKTTYDLLLSQYRENIKKIETQIGIVEGCEANVAEILQEIKDIVKSAKLPDEFSIDLTNKNDILFRVAPDSEYLQITEETLASSAIYIAAFKLHCMYANIFRVVHFDVSFLDYVNREKVLQEAKEMNIQLLTESPATNKKELELKITITES